MADLSTSISVRKVNRTVPEFIINIQITSHRPYCTTTKRTIAICSTEAQTVVHNHVHFYTKMSVKHSMVFFLPNIIHSISSKKIIHITVSASAFHHVHCWITQGGALWDGSLVQRKCSQRFTLCTLLFHLQYRCIKHQPSG